MSLEAVQASCEELREGFVQRNNAYMPEPIDLSINTRRYDRTVAEHDARKGLDRLMHTGIVDMDFGRGKVRMVGLTEAEQDKLIKLKGIMPDGRNASGLSLEEKREALNGKALPKGVKPRLRHM